jgi:hypothetical protein
MATAIWQAAPRTPPKKAPDVTDFCVQVLENYEKCVYFK